MRPLADTDSRLAKPELLDRAVELNRYLKTLSTEQIIKAMNISEPLALKTKQQITDWSIQPSVQRAAVDAFLGDIYSGLQVQSWTDSDRHCANDSLRILSGLYGILKPLDGIAPYRFEMGYKLPDELYSNLYKYWGDAIAKTLPPEGLIVNLAAVEYSKTVTPFVDDERVVTPSFLTVSPKTGKPTFVTVHAKIARGAFASWLIRNRIDDVDLLQNFTDIGYAYEASLSTAAVPVFVCQTFGGLGLSMRLK